jgi:intracellular multiplication protein IcmL
MVEEDNKREEGGLTTILLRNEFYKDNYTRAKVALVMLCLLNVFLAVSVVYRYLNPPQPQYFPTNSQYQLIKWHPLTDPIFDDNHIFQWVSQAVQSAFSLDYIHYREQLQTASESFTPSGWQWFVNSLKKTGNLTTLTQLEMVSNAQITGAPSMLFKGILDGRYVWEVEIPLLVTYNNLNRSIPQPLKITVIVMRMPVQDYKHQIAINQFLPLVQEAKLKP